MRLHFRAKVALVALPALLGSGCAQLSQLPQLTKADLRFDPPQSSKVYSSDGRLITTLHEEEDRTVVELERIPKYVQDAVIAIEDERFYQHTGVDLRAIFRAVVANATSGRIEEGGSTITQQYVKNAIIAPGETAEKTFERKIAEAALARQIETKLSKKQILERYLNTVYFGSGAYGIQAAARTYFGEAASDLSLAQAATLAGVIRSPETYDPFKNPKASRARRDLVLRQMLRLGWIEEDQAAKAMRRPTRLRKVQEKDRYPAPYFVDYVQRLLTWDPRFKVLGKTVEQRLNKLFQGGLRIYTTLDLEQQEAAEDAVESVLPYESDPYASLVAIEPHGGYIRAMVGGRDYFARPKEDPYAKLNLAVLHEPNLGRSADCGSKKEENRAPGCGRQAGSAFKPFALVAALKQGMSLAQSYPAPSCRVFPEADGGAPWNVCNYADASFSGGAASLLEATVHSVNVVYAALIVEIGAEAVVEIARAMGIRTELLPVPSAVLGTNAVNPLDMASAFGTLAADGVYHPPVAIVRIVDTTTGRVLYRDPRSSQRVIEAPVADLATSALEQVITRGTGTGAQIGRPAAGKTGTAQEYRDAWFVGYTPELVAAVWIGYPQGEIEMKPSCAPSTSSIPECIPTRTTTSYGVTGGSFPASIWQAFMLQALSGVPASSFQVPADGLVVTVDVDTRTGCAATALTPDEYRATQTFPAGSEPSKNCNKGNTGGKIPDVSGLTAAKAEEVLQGAGFNVARSRTEADGVEEGHVAGQDPAAGKRAPKGSKVTIEVASDDVEPEPEPKRTPKPAATKRPRRPPEREPRIPPASRREAVPSVVGSTRSAAEATLRSRGFVPQVVVQPESNPLSARTRSNRVWKQNPAGGTPASRGATVTIYVNP